MKITKRKLNALIADEKKASKEYRSLGLPRLSRSEAGHKSFLSKLRVKLFGRKSSKRKRKKR